MFRYTNTCIWAGEKTGVINDRFTLKHELVVIMIYARVAVARPGEITSERAREKICSIFQSYA